MSDMKKLIEAVDRLKVTDALDRMKTSKMIKEEKDVAEIEDELRQEFFEGTKIGSIPNMGGPGDVAGEPNEHNDNDEYCEKCGEYSPQGSESCVHCVSEGDDGFHGDYAYDEKKPEPDEDWEYEKRRQDELDEAPGGPDERDAIAELSKLPQPIGINGGSYTYRVDVTKQPLRFVASDGSVVSNAKTLRDITEWMDDKDDWLRFLDGEEDLRFLLDYGIVRSIKPRKGPESDQEDHELRNMGLRDDVNETDDAGNAEPEFERRLAAHKAKKIPKPQMFRVDVLYPMRARVAKAIERLLPHGIDQSGDSAGSTEWSFAVWNNKYKSADQFAADLRKVIGGSQDDEGGYSPGEYTNYLKVTDFKYVDESFNEEYESIKEYGSEKRSFRFKNRQPEKEEVLDEYGTYGAQGSNTSMQTQQAQQAQLASLNAQKGAPTNSANPHQGANVGQPANPNAPAQPSAGSTTQTQQPAGAPTSPNQVATPAADPGQQMVDKLGKLSKDPSMQAQMKTLLDKIK